MTACLDIAALDAALAARISEKKLPGVSVALRGPEGELFARGYGVRDAAGAPIDADTVMGVASMSKSTVGLALAMLAAEGKCSLDDPVIRYFPRFRIAGTPRQAVTLRHLATHTAGIPPMEPLEWSIAVNTPYRGGEWAAAMRASAPNAMDTVEQVIDYIASCGYPAVGAPGEHMSYSNEGYAILSYVVDMAAGEPLEAFLARRVFAPMGMTRTVLDIDGAEARALAGGNITSLWERDEGGVFTADDDWSVLPPFRGCACVKSTARDMARYYQCLSNGGVIDGVRAVPAAAVELMTGAAFPAAAEPYYCLGLNKRAWRGHVVCEHSGGLHGVSTHGGLLLGENYGFTALSNEGDQDTDDLCWLMYNAVIGRPLGEEHVWLTAAAEPFADPQMLLGRYISHEGEPETAEVYADNGALACRKGGAELTMTYCGGTWFLLYDGEGRRAGRVRFHVRGGSAWGAQFYTRIYQRLL